MINEFTIYPERMKQLQLIKIPIDIVENHKINDGDIVIMGIIAENGERLNTGYTFRVTSGKELYVPKTLRGVIKKYYKITFNFIKKFEK